MKGDEKHNGKTLSEWREYIKKDSTSNIRSLKYIIVLEGIIEELQQEREKWKDEVIKAYHCGQDYEAYKRMKLEPYPNDRFVRASMYWLFGFLTCYFIFLIMNYGE